MNAQPRIRAFLFAVFHRDGTRADVVFYAASETAATKLARKWAQKVGHRRVELVPDEVVA